MKFIDILNFYKTKINEAISASTVNDPLYAYSLCFTLKEFADFNRSIYLSIKEANMEENLLTHSIKYTSMKLLVVIKQYSSNTSEYNTFVNACQKVAEILFNNRYQDSEDKLNDIHSNRVEMNILERENYLVCELLLTLS
ncbi:MAG: hypothetical protein QW156_04850 [Candidatus Aenigmatarchaeota archaeon]